MSLSSAILMRSAISTTPVEVSNIVEFNESVANLLEQDNIITVQNAETDKFKLCLSLNDNFQELENACPEWQQETRAIHPEWLKHHQSEHLTKDQSCPVCMEEARSRVPHRRKKGNRPPEVMHVDLAAFEASADGNSTVLWQQSQLSWTKSPSCYLSSFQCRRRLSLCTSSHQRSSNSLSRPQSTSNHWFSNCANPSRRRRGIQQSEAQGPMLGQAHHSVLFSSTSTVFKQNGRELSVRRMLEASTSRTRMVVICLQVCRSHDEREGSRTTLAISTLWTTCGHLERT